MNSKKKSKFTVSGKRMKLDFFTNTVELPQNMKKIR